MAFTRILAVGITSDGLAHTTDMLIFYVVFAVYIGAVNLFGFTFLKSQRDDWYDDESRTQQGDGKLFLAALLGGALGVYIGMFLLKYRLKNLLFMIAMPVIATINIWLFFVAFRSGFTFFIIR